MQKKSYLMLFPLLLLGLHGCGGGSSGGDDTDMDSGGGTDATAKVTDDNALAAAQEATRGAGGAGSAGDELSSATDELASISGDAEEKIARTSVVSADCPGGGTLEATALNNTSGSSTIEYVATNCDTGGSEPFNGVMVLTVGEWDEFPNGGIESLIETDNGAFTGNGCSFEGAFGWRIYTEMPDTLPDGDYLFVFEYGTTSDHGFSVECDTGADFSLNADASVRNSFSYTVSGSTYSNYSNTVTVGGSFESPDGEGTLLLSAEDLSYPVDENNESLYGDSGEVCPDGGSITVTGADNTEVAVYFGDDAPDPHEVQVIGPDGYTAEFQTCNDFLTATP
ncbi:hypothetical protein SAMN03097708_02292 [Thiohalomonas denitrificans]|uniref:Lipoprotein n=2 Tax=Thiohalomonas denitrificans TaxID=415747 RepID=A0A1G5QKK5_9GAMM|nr:hypothetical protein SAMN03097708_02292 [Thiohalomonas denitrificans]